jgi:hypothetical protein
MPRGTMSFDLSDHVEAAQFQLAIQATDWALVSADMARWLRNEIEYGAPGPRILALENVRTMLGEFMEFRRVNLEDIP